MSKPDPRLAFTPRHAAKTIDILGDALKKRAGMIVLSGEPGVGKSTTLKKFALQQREAGQAVYMPADAAQSMDSLLEAVCAEAGLPVPAGGDRLTYLYALRDHLDARLKAGDFCAIIADNGSGIPDAMLRDLALLVDLERNSVRPIQIVMTGTPRLINRLNTPDFNQVRKEVGAVIKLEPFERDETGAYLQHCLDVAGYRGPSLFSFAAIDRIHTKTRGVPRAINQVAVATLSALKAGGGKLSPESVDAAVSAALAASGPETPIQMPVPMAPPVATPPVPAAPASEIVTTPATGGLVGQPQTMTVRMMLDKLDREFNPATESAVTPQPAPTAAPAPAPSPAETARVIADAADSFVFAETKPVAPTAAPAPVATPEAKPAPSNADLVADALAQVDAEAGIAAPAPHAPEPMPLAAAAPEAKSHNSARQRLMARLTGR